MVVDLFVTSAGSGSPDSCHCARPVVSSLFFVAAFHDASHIGVATRSPNIWLGDPTWPILWLTSGSLGHEFGQHLSVFRMFVRSLL